MWFDSHCHLHLVEDDAGAVVARCREAEVEDLLTVGIDVESSRRAVALAHEHGVRAAVGLHPNSADEFSDGVMEALEALVQDERVVAIGESGLDFYRDRARPDKQLAAFSAHAALAKDRDKALVIHTRDSLDEALTALERFGPPQRLVFHCFSGTPDQLRRALDLGAFISFAGNVSFKSAEDLRRSAALVPGDCLLIETDSPFLAPVPKRGRPNEPAYVSYVGKAVAAARGVDERDVALATTANARKLFGLA